MHGYVLKRSMSTNIFDGKTNIRGFDGKIGFVLQKYCRGMSCGLDRRLSWAIEIFKISSIGSPVTSHLSICTSMVKLLPVTE